VQWPRYSTSTKPTVFPLMQCGSGTGDTVTLGCIATGFTPSSLTFAWSRADGAALTDFIQYPPVQKDNYYTGVSQIRVSSQDWAAKNAFRCAVSHAAGDAEPPTLKVLAFTDEEMEASFSCVAKDFTPKDFQIKWLKNNIKITKKVYEIKTLTPEERKDENGTTLYSAASFLTLPSSEWTVDTENSVFNSSRGETQRPSVFMLPPLEHTKKEMVTLTCYVKDFFPREVLVSWLVDDEKAGSNYEFHTTNPVESHGSYSAYGQLSLSLKEWKNNGMVFSCVVYHESVANTTNAIVRSIGHRTFEKTNMVNLNMNIPETYFYQWNSTMEAEEDNMGSTALTFILLFLITLLFTIGTTAFKVMMSFYVRVVHRLGFDQKETTE
uniref:Ig-like domain-containing protein n=1 Tax=Cyclopterus lumpus TaxID=8103 RepID=A0A8C2XMA9_CYCLU